MKAVTIKMPLYNLLGGICGSMLALSITVLVVVLTVTQIAIEALMDALTYTMSLTITTAVKVMRTIWMMLLFVCGPLGLSGDATGYVNIDSVELSDATQKLGKVGPVRISTMECAVAEVEEQKVDAQEQLDALGGVVG